MSGEKLVDVLIDIRNHQREQMQTFEQAVRSQQEYIDLQRRGRSTFLFMVFAPWGCLALLFAYMLFEGSVFG